MVTDVIILKIDVPFSVLAQFWRSLNCKITILVDVLQDEPKNKMAQK